MVIECWAEYTASLSVKQTVARLNRPEDIISGRARSRVRLRKRRDGDCRRKALDHAPSLAEYGCRCGKRPPQEGRDACPRDLLKIERGVCPFRKTGVGWSSRQASVRGVERVRLNGDQI